MSQKSHPSGFQFFNGSKYSPRDMRLHCVAKDGFDNSVAYHVINDIAEAMANIELYVTEGDEVKPDHPLSKLVNKPNPAQDKLTFWHSVGGDYLLFGECFLQGTGMDNNGKPRKVAPKELWTVRPDKLDVVPSASGIPMAYEVSSASGNKRVFKVDMIDGFSSIYHVKNYNPENYWRGRSPLYACATAVDLHDLSMRWNNQQLKNGARPSGAFTTKEMLGDEEFARAKQQFQEMYSGDNNGTPLLLEGDAKWQEMGRSPLDMDFNNSIESAKKQIADAYNYPLPLISTDASSFNNVSLAREKLYEDVVIPMMERFIAMMNGWLAPLYGENVKVCMNKDSIDALEAKRDRKYKRMMDGVNNSIITINEARMELGFEPIKHDLADTLIAPMNIGELGQLNQPQEVKAKFTECEFKELGFMVKGTYKGEEIDLKVPKGVQENAQRGLELRKEHGRGGTEVGMASARKLSKGGEVTAEFVRKVASYFPRHEGDNLDENGRGGKPISNGYIAWQLWGGDEGRRWSEAKRDELDRIDENV